MTQIYKIILLQPIVNLLILLYNVIPWHDLGLSIIILTIIIKLILHPLSLNGFRSQKSLQDLQPKLAAIKKKYANQQQEQAKAMMELYKENKINPFSSCLPLLIQLPIFIAVYQAIRLGVMPNASLPLYSFVHSPVGSLAISFGFLNLSKPYIPLAIITGILQYFQTKMLPGQSIPKKLNFKDGAKDESTMTMMNKQMKFMMPLFTIIIGISFPSGLMLYWFTNTLLSFLEQKMIFKNSH